MKAITLHRPWSSLIACGLKTIETRTHDRLRRLAGQTIAIHAAQKWDEFAFSLSWPLADGEMAVAAAADYGADESALRPAIKAARKARGCVVAVEGAGMRRRRRRRRGPQTPHGGRFARRPLPGRRTVRPRPGQREAVQGADCGAGAPGDLGVGAAGGLGGVGDGLTDGND
jgi:hypothetical protein